MLAGQLDRRVTFYRVNDADDDLSNNPGEPALIGHRWAQKTDVSDGEQMRAAQQGAQISSRFIVRSDSLTRSLTSQDVLGCEGRLYAIVGIKEHGGRRVGLEISVTSSTDQPR